jgi:cation diffusion facilitator CzcD-associated flavoprotein CzcO
LRIDQKGTTIEEQADIVINSTGFLNNWRWPNIANLQSYEGKLIHTARWDESGSWDGKRVAIIGNGSSAIQILPKMQKTAKHITTYIRSPTWISPNFAGRLAKHGRNFSYSDEEKREFREDGQKFYEYRKKIEQDFNRFFMAFFRGSTEQEQLHRVSLREMKRKLNNDPYLCEKLIPKWEVGCRRLTPGDGYLEALQEKNVTIDFEEILSLTKTGIRTTKGTEDFDIIVCATGFDVSFKPRWKMVGQNGVNLSEQWKDRAEAYMGICAPHMPNYFIFNGPNCPVGHGSLMGVLNFTADYMLRWCHKIASQNIK